MDRAVILAGGKGRNIELISGRKPKVLLKVAGKSVIEHVLDTLIELGIKDVVVVTDRPTYFEDITVRYGAKIGIRVRKQVGEEVVGALLSAADEIAAGALVVYGDTLAPKGAYETLLNAYKRFGNPVILVVPEVDVTLYGAVTATPDGTVTGFKEKPKEAVEGAYAFGGIAIYNGKFVELLEKLGSYEGAVNEYIGSEVMRVAMWSGWWVDIGFPWNLIEAQYFLLSQLRESRVSEGANVASTAVIKGPVIIEDEVTVEHYSIIKGPAYLGKGTFIGSHVLVRPFTSIGKENLISSYSEVVWSVLQDRVSVGRNCFLGYSVVGEGAVIEGGVITKLLLADPERYGIKVLRYLKLGDRMKLGAFIRSGGRVTVNTVLEPGSYV